MEKIELQEVIDTCENSGSEYIKLYRPLLGYEENVTLYRGIDDSMEDVIKDIEANIKIQVPGDFLMLYLISNGGKYFDLNLYSISTDKNDKDGLYYKNCTDSIRAEYNIPENMLIIGETNEYFVLAGIDEENYYYYCTWDKEDKEKGIEFDYFLEVIMGEIDYYTQAFSEEEDEEEEEK